MASFGRFGAGEGNFRGSITSHRRGLATEERQSAWRAAEPGRQTLRLLFDRPQRIKLVHLKFQEPNAARTQQFVLRWSSTVVDPTSKSSASSIICPPGTTAEREDYSVELVGVINLELGIIPDMSGGLAHASLTQLGIA